MSDDLLNRISLQLKPYERLGLGEFGDDRFAERSDRKFPCHVSEIPEVIADLDSDYDLIVPDGSDISEIHSIYFDTEDFQFFHDHHRGRRRRMKLRFRKYPGTQTSFFEIKRKNLKGKTLKERILTDYNAKSINKDLKRFLRDNGVENLEDLQRVLDVSYRRISFISKDRTERFSIDFEVLFNADEREGSFGELAVFEVKQERISTSPIVKKLRSKKIREASVSKYCLSLSQLRKHLKANRFKPTLRNLQAIVNEENISSELI